MTDEQNQIVMSRFEKEGHSFLIRIWKENRDNPLQAGIWRGWVQHVQSDDKKYFQSTDDIANIINGYLSHNPAFDQVFEPVQEDEQR
jgi:hypothetical protein